MAVISVGSLPAPKGTFWNQNIKTFCKSLPMRCSSTGQITCFWAPYHYRACAGNCYIDVDGKGSRVAKYMCLGTILDESLTRNAYVKYLFGMRIDMVACTRRNTRMYIGSVKYKAWIFRRHHLLLPYAIMFSRAWLSMNCFLLFKLRHSFRTFLLPFCVWGSSGSLSGSVL